MNKTIKRKKVLLLYILGLIVSSQSVVNGQNQLSAILDSIINQAIDKKAFPGAQLLIVHKGNTIHSKSYGFHKYNKEIKVENHHLYDLASITKVSSGLPLLMKLNEKKMIDLNTPIIKYIPSLKSSNKTDLNLKNILAHQAGLTPYIKFWESTLKEDGSFKKKTLQNKPSKKYPIKVSEHLYLHKKYKKNMLKEIRNSELSIQGNYVYSGLIFLLLPDVIESLTKADFQQLLDVSFYLPLGADRITYNPLDKFPLHEIIPTEIDSVFRHQLVHGTVHDEAAAFLGGISCNAGLFSNAESLSKLFLMYVQSGTYANKEYISKSTIESFTSRPFPNHNNHRGLGFDKPYLDIEKTNASSYMSKYSSASSFGHSGFTGTLAWADPEYELVFIFLSNRVYPSRKNTAFYDLKVRKELLDAVYLDILEE